MDSHTELATTDYNEFTLRSKSAIKRFTHKTRYGIGQRLCLQGNPKNLLDYGTGSAHLLIELHKQSPELIMCGFEPVPKMFREATKDCAGIRKISIVQSLEEIRQQRFDKVTCFEVFEHLGKDDTLQALSNMKRLLQPNGQLIVSIPIETGFAGLCKNIVRFLIGVPHDKKWKNILKAFTGQKVEREGTDGYYPSHVGFRHKDLEVLFKQANLKLVSKQYSPIPILGSLVNSQIFYILKAF